MTSPSNSYSSAPGGTGTSPTLGSTYFPGATTATALNNQRQNAQFPTLNPPPMGTLVYAPNVQILIAHNGMQHDVSKDIIRGQIVRKENSASSLFFTLANPGLRYTQGQFSRMDRVVVYLTRTQKLQVFSGYLDTIPWVQAYPGTIDFRATCTLKRLLHTWWNPTLGKSMGFFDQMGPTLGTDGDGQVTDSGIGSILRNILEQVGGWPQNTVHIQNFPQEFITFLNNYMLTSNMQAMNAQIGQQFTESILGDDTVGGPMGAVGYQGSDPVGTAASATNDTVNFYLGQIVNAVDKRGMGPIVNVTANSQTLNQTADVLESAQSDGGITPSGQALATNIHESGQQLAQYASNQATQNQNSDAAILALACAMVESGAGTPAIQMLANASDPETLTFWHTGLNTNGSDAGLFGQSNNGQWGTAAQRMNPLSSAGMFLDALQSKTGWRNMDGGQAIWQVQQSSTSSIPLYSAAIAVATPLVLAYRQAQQGATNQANTAIGLIPGAGAANNVLGGGTNAIGSIAGNVAGGATNSPLSTTASVLQAGGPNPNSEGAINAAMSMIGTPYNFGGNTISTGIDCSRMVELAFIAGTGIDPGRDTYAQITRGIPVVPTSAAQRGDILQTNGGGHTGIYLGGGLWIQTGGPNPMPGPQPINPATCYSARRMCGNGGFNPAVPFTPILGATGIGNTSSAPGTGVPPDSGTGSGVGTGGGSGSGDNEPIARNLFTYMFEPTNYAITAADLQTGEKAYIDDQPLIQIIRALCSASLRNFQSSPTGDFIAYYPDPFGIDGKPAILSLEDIELKDCHIDLSDDPMATHVYIEGSYTMIGQSDQELGWLTTSGVATVENPGLYQRLIKAAPGDIDSGLTATQLMKKFGVRPYRDSYQMAGNAGLEFLLACQIFMGKWAAQYETNIGLTFMPELLPGMRVNLVGHNLTVYCSAVTHDFDWERGFTTSATVSGAANPQAASSIFSSLPGFLNPTSTNVTGGGNTSNNGQNVTGYAPIMSGGLLDKLG